MNLSQLFMQHPTPLHMWTTPTARNEANVVRKERADAMLKKTLETLTHPMDVFTLADLTNSDDKTTSARLKILMEQKLVSRVKMKGRTKLIFFYFKV